MTTHGEPHADRVSQLLGPTVFEVSCDRCFELLDEYIELEIAGADADARISGLRTHLEGCPACREEYESLHALLAESAGS